MHFEGIIFSKSFTLDNTLNELKPDDFRAATRQNEWQLSPSHRAKVFEANLVRLVSAGVDGVRKNVVARTQPERTERAVLQRLGHLVVTARVRIITKSTFETDCN